MHWEDDNIESTKLIDSYRYSLFQDEWSALILTFLYYQNQLDLLQIQNYLHIPKAQIEQVIKKLYEAHFIQLTDENEWTCSNKGISVIETFGFGTESAKLLLDDIGVAERDKYFLICYFNSNYPDYLTTTATQYLRSLKLYFKMFERSNPHISTDATSLSYKLLIGSNPILRGLSPSTFLESILKHPDCHNNSGTDISFRAHEHYYAVQCKTAIESFFSSNECLYSSQVENEHADFLRLRMFIYFEEHSTDEILLNFINSNTEQFFTTLLNLINIDTVENKKTWLAYLTRKSKRYSSHKWWIPGQSKKSDFPRLIEILANFLDQHLRTK